MAQVIRGAVRRGRSGTRRFALGLAAIAAVGFAIRVAYVLIYRLPHRPFGGDAGFYTNGANLLARGYGFIQPLSFTHAQSAGHPPLYILWLVLPSLVWPSHEPTQLVHMIWTCVLGTGTIAVVGLAGREIVSERVGLLAAALTAVYPNVWVQDGMLRSETVAIFTVALIILLAYRFVHRPTMLRLVAVGAACGLAALARSELVLAAPLLIIPLVVGARGVTGRTKVVWIVAGGAAALIVIAPWVGYNMTRFKQPVTLSTNSGGTFAAANCHSTYYGDLIGYKDYACSRKVFGAAARDYPNWSHFDESQQDQALRTESEKYVRAHLDRVPVVVVARWGRILSVYKPFQEVRLEKIVEQQEWTVGYAIVWTFWAAVLAAIAGGIVLRRRRIPVWPLLVVPVITFVAVGITFAQTRYRSPAEVSVLLLAAVAIDAGLRAFVARRTRRAAPGIDPTEVDLGAPDDEAVPAVEPSRP